MFNDAKALKKLAAQIAHTIKNDTTYRNIPFGNSMLDVHSDGETVLLAVKILGFAKNSFNVREFQMPVAKLRKFLVGNEMRMLIKNSDIMIYRHDYKIMKQISQGIAHIVSDSEKKNETWVFPFYDHVINFKKEYLNSDYKGVQGQIASIKACSNNFKPRDFSPISGIILRNHNDFAQVHFVHLSIEFGIYKALTRTVFSLETVEAYKNIRETSMWIDAA